MKDKYANNIKNRVKNGGGATVKHHKYSTHYFATGIMAHRGDGDTFTVDDLWDKVTIPRVSEKEPKEPKIDRAAKRKEEKRLANEYEDFGCF